MDFIDKFSFLKCFVVMLMLLGLFSGVSATEIESGFIQASSTGTVTEDIGFRPDYVEFISAQQVESPDAEFSVSTNSNCPQNVNGWSEGAVLFDSSGTSAGDIDKQFAIGAYRNSDSTNDHRVGSSDTDVIKNVYTGRNGGKCGELEVSAENPTDDGFVLDVENKYSSFDEVIRYKAYQFPDNMPFEAGMVKINSTGDLDVDTGFQPANIHVRASQQIDSKNTDTQFGDNDPEQDNTLGRSKGYATLDEDGTVIDQQSIGTASSSDSTNAHRSIASDNYVLNTAYVGQDADLFGRLRAKITNADSSGFRMEVDDKWSQTDEVFLYRAWGFSYYNFQIGYKVIDSEGSQRFNTGFEPDAIDIYAEQQIEGINQEVVTPGNSGCSNAGGWSNGYYEGDDDVQWALSTGRSSDSQNSHRVGSTTSSALNNIYSGQNGEDCGNFQGTVTSTDSNGFEMSFSYDSNFETNYGEEMVYYRAIDFRQAPPTTEDIRFYDSPGNHAFAVESTIKEGSNNINDCEISAESPAGYQETYDAEVNQINSTHSQCYYDSIEYDDNSNWETQHDEDGELLRLEVSVTASGIDGFSSTSSAEKRFPNHEPSVADSYFMDYPYIHAFNSTSVITDSDAEIVEEVQSCEIEFRDDDGNTVSRSPQPDQSFGNSSETACLVDNINTSMPLPDGDGFGEGFEVSEEIQMNVTVTDVHGSVSEYSGTHEIPNDPPSPQYVTPRNNSYVDQFPVDLRTEVSDQRGDRINVTVYGEGQQLESGDDLSTGDSLDYTWDVPNIGKSNYEWTIELEDRWSRKLYNYSLTKIIGERFRSRVLTDLNYSSMIVNTGSNRYVEFTVQNRVNKEKNLTMNLSGVSAEFLEGNKVKNVPDFPPQSQETYTLRVSPETTTKDELMVTVTNNNLGIKTTETIPVDVIESVSESNREVPGVGLIQLLFLFSVATVLYSVRL